MVSTAFHILMNLVLANRLFKKHPRAKLAMIIASALPDLDLIVSMFIYLFTQDPDITIGFHRSLSHSFVVYGFIFVVGCFFYLVDRYILDSSRPWLLEATVGGVLGLTVHVLLDFLYFSGVAVLWPLTLEHYALFPYSFESFSHETQKLLSALDYTTDFGLYVIVYFMAIENQTDLEKLKTLKWLTLLYGIWAFTFLGVAFFPIGRNDYVILQYGLGGAILLIVTISLPIFMRNTMVIQSDLPTRFNMEKLAILLILWASLVIPLLAIPNIEFIFVGIYWLGIIVIENMTLLLCVWTFYQYKRKKTYELFESPPI